MIHIYQLDDDIEMFKRCVEPACVELKTLFGIDATAHLISPSAGDQFLFFDEAGNRITDRRRIPIGLGTDNLYDVRQLEPVLHDSRALVLMDINFGSNVLSKYGLHLARYLCDHGFYKERILLFSNYLNEVLTQSETYWSFETHSKKEFPPLDGAERLAYRLRGKCAEANLPIPAAHLTIPADLGLVPSPDERDGYNESLRQAALIAPTNYPVLITGENGVGKLGVASIVHRLSPRSARAWIHLNSSAIPPQLFESELFGNEAGAFTGATKARPGYFEAANGNTLYLDEIGELLPEVQTKLNTFLDTGEFYRLGGRVAKRSDARIVAATNRNLGLEVRAGRFREDLYWRLGTFTIHIPPLRERPTHIKVLASQFARKCCSSKKVTNEVFEMLSRYSWRGNVRELESCIKRACIHSDRTITPEHITVDYEMSGAIPIKEALIKEALTKEPSPTISGPTSGNTSIATKMKAIDVREDWVKTSTHLAEQFKKRSFLPVIAKLVEQHTHAESRRELARLILIATRFACERPAEARARGYAHANALLKLVGLIGHFASTGQLTVQDQGQLVVLSGASDEQIPDWASFSRSVGQRVEESWRPQALQRLLKVIRDEINGKQI
jgi:DNA-binding NtrC family response regulator